MFSAPPPGRARGSGEAVAPRRPHRQAAAIRRDGESARSSWATSPIVPAAKVWRSSARTEPPRRGGSRQGGAHRHADRQGPEAVKMERSADWYPLRLARELDRAILDLRHNHLDIGLWVLKSKGDVKKMLELDAALRRARTTGSRARPSAPAPLSRLDVSSRSIFAIIEKGSCFAGTLLELVLAADGATCWTWTRVRALRCRR